ncbi:hypothetical protein EON64_20265, partial [archaeon]
MSQDEDWQAATAAAVMSDELRRSTAYRNFLPLTSNKQRAVDNSTRSGHYQSASQAIEMKGRHLDKDHTFHGVSGTAISMSQLEDEVSTQRSLLMQVRLVSEVNKFDTAWCLDSSTGHFQTVHLERDTKKLNTCLPCSSRWQSRSSSVAQDVETGQQAGEQSAGSEMQVLDIRDVIKQDLETVHKEAGELQEELACQTAAERGFEILVQFILDVLGRKSAAAHIYAMKMDMEYTKTEY